MSTLCLFFLAFVVPGEGPAAWTADVALARLQARYDGITDVAADFTQTVEKPATGLTLTRSGRLFLKKPGLMRFDYTAPDRMFYVADGKSFYQYLPDSRLAYKLAVEGSSLAGPFLFLVGHGKLAEQFDVVSFSDEGERVTVTLKPRQGNTSYTQLTLGARKEPLEIDRLTIVDAGGTASRLELKGITHEALPLTGFEVKIPEGVRVQEL